jgi:uncharacterized protein (UPF0264 family)
VDVKDPSKGPLGAPDNRVVAEVSKAVDGAAPLSASIGDADVENMDGHVALARAFADEGVSIVKIAVARLSHTQAERALSFLRKSIPAHMNLAAAVYADITEPASVSGVLDISRRVGVDGVLLDTAMKDGRSLFNHITPEFLRGICDSARSSGLFLALAGCLGADDIARVALINPDYVGFRSAIAANGRGAAGVDAAKVREIKDLILATAVRR